MFEEHTMREAYASYVAEARACGYEYLRYREWTGEIDLHAEKQELYAELEERDELDLY